jgi:DNA-binding NtrC family response regulator
MIPSLHSVERWSKELNVPALKKDPLLEDLAGPGEGMLLALLQASSNPLVPLLDLLLQSLRARQVLWVERGNGARRALGRRPPGEDIEGAGRLVAPERAEQVFLQHRPLLVELDLPGGRSWSLSCPVPLGGDPRAALFVEGPAPAPELPSGALQSWMARLAPWINLARELGEPKSRRLARTEVEESPAPASGRGPGHGGFAGVIGSAPAMQEVLRTVSLVAPSEAAVLIEGESGTGKELIAKAIHQKSRRAAGPFVPENCAACPEGLLESEFFGVERGAFTGASRSKPGLFERAHGGTLFLDEIGEMDPSLQRKLLRALQEREVRRVGGGEPIPVHFRLVSATNRVLSEEARAGRFRSDLYYRIEVVTIRLPPLRERREDIPRLISHFLALHAAEAGVPPPEVEPAALRLLGQYSWPGNVRELENEMWRAVALGAPCLSPESLSGKIRGRLGEGAPEVRRLLGAGGSLEAVEREVLGGLIREALETTGGNKIRAAQLLGIPKTSLYRRLRRYSISPPPRGRLPDRFRDGLSGPGEPAGGN